MARAFLRSLPRPNFADTEVRLAYLILIATVPAALLGFFFEDFFATEVRSPWVVVFNLVFVGVLFLVAEAVGRKTGSCSKLGFLGAFGVGLAELPPGRVSYVTPSPSRPFGSLGSSSRTS
jgi:undecaprenyl-diphosphatase